MVLPGPNLDGASLVGLIDNYRVSLALGVPTIIFSLVTIGLQIPMIVFCFKAKKAIDAEAGGPTVK